MRTPPRAQSVADAKAVFQAAIAGAQPRDLLRSVHLGRLLDRPPSAFRRVVLVGAGKASMAMAGVLEDRLGGVLDDGLVVVPHGYRATFPAGQQPPDRVEVVEAGHPVPDEAGIRATERVLRLADSLGGDDLLVVALSGGGSSLWPAFADGISLDDAQETFRLLLTSGADIHAINIVRRQLSRTGGGGLVRAAHPATVLALVISDVVGDDLTTIASGPTVPDPTTRADALGVLRRFGLIDRVPESVQALLKTDRIPGWSGVGHVRTELIGSNRDALEAAHREAERLGYTVALHPESVAGEAREVGRQLARDALAVEADSPVCLLWGGETTVTVTGEGRGGRNQEVALAAALELDGTARSVVVLSGGTDGIDGPTDAAGAWATPLTAVQARSRGLSLGDYLARNDAYAFFDALDGLVRTGPTHTNVMDVQVAIVHPAMVHPA